MATDIYLSLKPPTVADGLSVGCRTRIRTQTNRVRVCRATFTQFGNAYCSNIYYNASSKNVNTFIKKIIELFLKGRSQAKSAAMQCP